MRNFAVGCAAALTLAVGLTSTAAAQEKDDAKSEQAKIFDLLDKNSDGSITPDEIGEAQQQSFERLLRVGDKDNNGTLTRAEYTDALKPEAPATRTPQPADGRRGGRRRFDPAAFFKRFDRDGDGKLKLSDLPERARPRLKPLFDRLGKDEITVEDLQRTRRRPTAEQRRRFAERRFKRLDKDGNGKVEKSELTEQEQRRFRFVFARVQKDAFTLDEYMDAIRRASNPQAMFERFDRNKDGKLALSELPEQMRPRFKPLFDRLDQDELTAEEFTNAVRQRRMARRPGDRRRPGAGKRPQNRSKKKKPDAK